MNYLILDNLGNSIGQGLRLDSNALSKIYDGLIKVYKFENERYWRLEVHIDENSSVFLPEWKSVAILD
jgi:hypothetical protein